MLYVYVLAINLSSATHCFEWGRGQGALTVGPWGCGPKTGGVEISLIDTTILGVISPIVHKF